MPFAEFPIGRLARYAKLFEFNNEKLATKSLRTAFEDAPCGSDYTLSIMRRVVFKHLLDESRYFAKQTLSGSKQSVTQSA